MVLFWYMTADEEPFVCSRCGEQIRHKWTVMAPGVVWCDRDDCEAELRQIRRRERREYRKKCSGSKSVFITRTTGAIPAENQQCREPSFAKNT
jgi:hypothetical protein